MSEKLQFFVKTLEQLRVERGNWNAQWEEAAARLMPMHVGAFTSHGLQPHNTPGLKNHQKYFDATAALANQRFAAVMESLSTPQSGTWHRLVPSDKTLKKNRQVRQFFDDVNELLFSYRYRPAANFVGNIQKAYVGLGAYGNGVMYVDQPEGSPGLRYRDIALAEAYFLENHAGVVDTMYRTWRLTARQAVQRFGADSLPQQIVEQAQQAGRDGDQNKFEFLHVVMPREDWSPVRVDALGKRFASFYLCVTPQHAVREGGYDSFPFVVARYTQASGELYGRGPAQWVLPSIKLLDEQKKTVLKQGHRVVDPVLLAYDDGVLDGFSLRAGAINKGGVSAEGRPLVHTLPTGNVALGDKMMEMERQVINDAFLITLFQILVDTPQMTATEVLERAREKGLLIAPTAGRIQAEFLGPLIERELDLLLAQGLLPPMPAILRKSGGEYKIEYDSPMSRMQRAEKAAGFMRALDQAANYAKMTNDLAPLDFFNFDTAMPEILDINAAPVAWTRTIDEVNAVRAQRAEQQQQQQMMQNAGGLAQAMKAVPELAKGQ